MTNEEILKVLESLEGFKYRNVYTEEQIEKDRNSLNKLKEQLRIGGVSQQRELLLAFLLWRDETWGLREDIEGNKEQIEEYLKANNCG